MIGLLQTFERLIETKAASVFSEQFLAAGKSMEISSMLAPLVGTDEKVCVALGPFFKVTILVWSLLQMLMPGCSQSMVCCQWDPGFFQVVLFGKIDVYLVGD